MLASGARRVERIHIWAVEDADSPRPEFADVLLERRVGRLGVVGERHGDDRQFLADPLDEDAQGEGVAYPCRQAGSRCHSGTLGE